MSLPMASHPSPRPGFTHVADARARRQGPIVVVASYSQGGLTALHRAAEEAALHSVPLYVVDACSGDGLRTSLLETAETFVHEERTTALSILRNPNVTVLRDEGDDSSYITATCRELGASLLVIDPGCLDEDEYAGGLSRPVNADLGRVCDVLVVGERSGVSR